GGFGIAAVVLELFDITDDFHEAKTSGEEYGIGIKGFSVLVMGLGSAAQLLAGIFPAGVFTIIAMNPWFSVALMATGFTYLIATMALNYFKQDSVGWWLRKCCWSRTLAYRYAETAEGEQEEVRALMEIQLSRDCQKF
ncbi:hypothetical protein ALP18_04848, partial [Pseudomonas amygdali pv. myricae]